MAEGRMLKKRISKSRKFAALKNDKSRLTWLLLLPHTDVSGRLEANLCILKGTIAPYVDTLTTRSIAACLKELHEIGLILLYENEGEKYLQVLRFHDFNRIDPSKEAESHIPPPTPAQLQCNSSVTPPEVKGSEVKVKGRERFVPPTLEEVQKYITEKGYKVDGKKFMEYFSESGWVDSKGNKVRNWKQKIITWSGGRNEPVNKTSETMKAMIARGELK